MKNIDLETFYSSIEKHILLASMNSGIRGSLPFIIRACRLKPYSIFNNTFSKRIKLENHWVDEFGNSIRIDKQNTKLYINDPTISGTKISTDLFFGRSIENTAIASKFIWLIRGSILDKTVYLCSFYGKDEYLRSFFYRDKWFKISPLLQGLNILSITLPSINRLSTNAIDIKTLDVNLLMQPDDHRGSMLPMRSGERAVWMNEIDNNILKGIIY